MPTTTSYGGYTVPILGDSNNVPSVMATYAGQIDPWLVKKFANSAARTAALSAASLGSGQQGMITYLSSPGRFEYYTGTAWVPLVPGKTVVGAAIFGSNHDGVSPIITQTYQDIVSTNTSGGFSTTFPQAFANGLFSIQFTDGDATGSGTVYGGLPFNHTLNHAEGVARDMAGNPVVSGNRRMFITSVGW